MSCDSRLDSIAGGTRGDPSTSIALGPPFHTYKVMQKSYCFAKHQSGQARHDFSQPGTTLCLQVEPRKSKVHADISLAVVELLHPKLLLLQVMLEIRHVPNLCKTVTGGGKCII